MDVKLTEKLVKASMAIRLIVLFFEGSLVELSQAEGANEVFRVEFPEHGCDAAARDGFVASGAERSPLAVIVGFAIWLPFMLEERAPVERLPAFLEKNEFAFNSLNIYFMTYDKRSDLMGSVKSEPLFDELMREAYRVKANHNDSCG